jgi:beta-mannosidase
MRSILKTLFFAGLLATVSAAQSMPATIPVTVWQMQDSAALSGVTGQQISGGSYAPSGWYNAVVPGTVLQTLADSNHVYPKPDSGLTAESVIPDLAAAQKKYWYYSTFTVPPADTAGHQIWLCFDGINYMADIYLNGRLLPASAAAIAPGTTTKVTHTMVGAFTRGKFNVTGLAKAGANYLAVKIYPNLDPGAYHTKEAGACGTNGGTMTEDGPTFIASQGWDWIPTVPDRDMGIWNDVYVRITGPVVLRQPFARCSLPAPYTAASCILSVQLSNSTSTPVTGVLQCVVDTVAAYTIDSTVTIGALDTATITFNPQNRAGLLINNPRLWWPNNMGSPNLYKVGISFTPTGSAFSDSTQFYFGIRTITAVRGNTTLGLQVSINGKRVTMRGGSWGMDDFMKRVNVHKLEAKVKYHQLQNFNTVRNWIGGIDDERFYDYCDRYGMLVWDDFWCPNSSDGPSTLATVIDTALWLSNATDKILRWRNHACIYLWCARNDVTPITALWNGLQYRATVLDGTRIIQQSSGTDDVVSGGPYTWNFPDSAITELTAPGFHTELGGPTFPSIESVDQFIPAAYQLPITTASTNNAYWSFHDYCSGNGTPANYTAGMTSRFGAASTLYDFCRKSQLMNYDQDRALFEALNSRKWSSAVALYLWMSNPAWPSTMWQTYDYYLEGTGAFYGAMHACEPIHVQYYYVPGSTTTKGYTVCNNTANVLTNYTVKALVYDISGALSITDSQVFATIPADTTVSGKSLPVLPAALSAAYLLEMRLTDASGNPVSKNVYWLPKSGQSMSALLTMPTATLAMTAPKATLVTNGTSDTLKLTLKNGGTPVAVAARLKVVRATSGIRVLPAYHSDNYFSIVPGDSQAVTISFDIADLNGEQPKLMLSGLNIDSVQLPIGASVTAVHLNRESGFGNAGMYASFSGGRLRLYNTPAGSAWKVTVFDMRGRAVLEASGAPGQGAVVSLKRLRHGAYVAVAKAGGQVVRSMVTLSGLPDLR